ncbi:hypothetical protein HPB52_001065 [Rhipicephalus sanguineus]|uniref:Uncharacterized protein n=1 Tax=Rhipicephalus sanguineus TaxID=34632 RepID=A0A9D4SVE0_RHISA|nr:hypothetical protein HPB52_001065 [Rhipicephalus sanguineus]
MTHDQTDYAATLCVKDQARYSEKVALCGVDPFELRESDCVRDVNLWPGWMREPSVKEVSSDSVILKTKVNHSQSLNRQPVDSWALCKCDGKVVAAHCTCMAGNGDACSDVAALLFYVEYGVCVRQERSCTDSANSWLPMHIRKLDVRPNIAEMDFTSSTMKKTTIRCRCQCSS